MRQLKIYFARAMDDLTEEEIKQTDRYVKKEMDARKLILLNPYREFRAVNDVEDIIVSQNNALLEEADVILADLAVDNYTYVGAVFEVVQASQKGIPVVAYVGDTGLERRYYLHHYSDFICRDLCEALDYIAVAMTDAGSKRQIEEEMDFYNEIANASTAEENYEEISRNFYRISSRDISLYQQERGRLKEILWDKCTGKDVLEIGCGTGDWTKYAIETADNVTCIESSENMIKKAARSIGDSDKLAFIKGNILEDNLTERQYDVVILYFLMSIFPPLAQQRMLTTLKHMLKKDGVAIFGESANRSSASSSGFGRRKIERREASEKTFHIYKEYFSIGQLNALIQSHGYETIELSSDNRWFIYCVAGRGE